MSIKQEVPGLKQAEKIFKMKSLHFKKIPSLLISIILNI